MSVAKNIKEARLSAKMTQKELADKCGIADSAIRKYESGKVSPKLPMLEKIANALGTSPAHLMGWEDNESNSSTAKNKTTGADYGSRIIKARKSHGITQKELADSMRLTVAAIRQYENGEKIPDIENLRKIAGAIGCSVVDLIPMNISVLESVEPLLTEDEKKELSNRAIMLSSKIACTVRQSNDAMKTLTKTITEAFNDILGDFKTADLETYHSFVSSTTTAMLNDDGWEKVKEYISDLAQNPKYQKTDED